MSSQDSSIYVEWTSGSGVISGSLYLDSYSSGRRLGLVRHTREESTAHPACVVATVEWIYWRFNTADAQRATLQPVQLGTDKIDVLDQTHAFQVINRLWKEHRRAQWILSK